MSVLTIWSDLRCPWAYVAAVRLHRMRDHLGADEVLFDFRAYPLEIFDESLRPEHEARAEMAVAAQLEPKAFSTYDHAVWPTTFLPAFEAQKWGYSLGQETGERFDFALRRAFFLHSHNLSMRRELLAVARTEQLPDDQLAEALDDGRFRKAVTADVADARQTEIEGSPQVFLPDGTTHHNPGTRIRWERGFPIVEADHPSVYEELIQVASIDL